MPEKSAESRSPMDTGLGGLMTIQKLLLSKEQLSSNHRIELIKFTAIFSSQLSAGVTITIRAGPPLPVNLPTQA